MQPAPYISRYHEMGGDTGDKCSWEIQWVRGSALWHRDAPPAVPGARHGGCWSRRSGLLQKRYSVIIDACNNDGLVNP